MVEGMSTATPTLLIADWAQLRRVGRWTFPVDELVTSERRVAQLGRDSGFSMFFGRGRRVRVDGAGEWRIKATTSGRHIVPIVRAAAGTIAVSGPLFARRSYGINGLDYGYYLIPVGKPGLRRPRAWVLRRHELDVASIDDTDRTIATNEPIPLAAVLLVFTLITHGIPGENNMMPKRE